MLKRGKKYLILFLLINLVTLQKIKAECCPGLGELFQLIGIVAGIVILVISIILWLISKSKLEDVWKTLLSFWVIYTFFFFGFQFTAGLFSNDSSSSNWGLTDFFFSPYIYIPLTGSLGYFIIKDLKSEKEDDDFEDSSLERIQTRISFYMKLK